MLTSPIIPYGPPLVLLLKQVVYGIVLQFSLPPFNKLKGLYFQIGILAFFEELLLLIVGKYRKKIRLRPDLCPSRKKF